MRSAPEVGQHRLEGRDVLEGVDPPGAGLPREQGREGRARRARCAPRVDRPRRCPSPRSPRRPRPGPRARRGGRTAAAGRGRWRASVGPCRRWRRAVPACRAACPWGARRSSILNSPLYDAAYTGVATTTASASAIASRRTCRSGEANPVRTLFVRSCATSRTSTTSTTTSRGASARTVASVRRSASRRVEDGWVTPAVMTAMWNGFTSSPPGWARWTLRCRSRRRAGSRGSGRRARARA